MAHRAAFTGRNPASRWLSATSISNRPATERVQQSSEVPAAAEELGGCYAVGIPLRIAARRLEGTHGLAAAKFIAERGGVYLQATSSAGITAIV